MHDGLEKFHLVLFCHSMCGIKSKVKVVVKALGMLVEQPDGAMAVVFHREETPHLEALVCHKTASLPMGAVCVADDDEILDRFAPFITGFKMQDKEVDKVIWSNG